SGKFKDMLNGARPITQEERDLVQNFIMKTYDKFLGIVSKERNVPTDLLRNTIADGRILSGKEAFEHKLIDGLGELDDAFRKAKELGNAPDKIRPSAIVLRRRSVGTFRSFETKPRNLSY